MKPFILLPLATGEQKRIYDFDVTFLHIHTEECYPKEYQSIFWSEIGKYLYCFKEVKDFDGRLYGMVQNRRFFKHLDKLNVEKNEVILAPEEWHGISIKDQFRHCHYKYFSIFDEICQKIDIDHSLLERRYFSPHNVFVSDMDFFIQYGEFLKKTLTPYFDPNINEKVGAWISERLLYVFAHSHFKVKTEPIEVLDKR